MRDESLFVVEPGIPALVLDRATYETTYQMNLKDITCVGDAYRKFINIDTGEIIDCAEHAKRMQEYLNR